MAYLRRVLGTLTAIWLCCQVGALAFVPVALRTGTTNTHIAHCSCGHGGDAACPMHHPSRGGSTPCAMRAVDTSGTAVLTSLVGTTGLPTDAPRSIQPPIAAEYSLTADTHVAAERPVPPDPPPPRF